MKELSLLLIITLTCGLLFAAAEYIVAIPSKSITTTDLRTAVNKLAANGLEIYYYNENQIIAGSSTPSYPLAKVLCPAKAGTLYLISKVSNGKDIISPSAGRILLDLGSSWLLQTDISEDKLRQMLANPVVRLNLKPIRFSDKGCPTLDITETRLDILNLISQINADSVQSYIQHLEDYQTRYCLAANHLAIATWIKDEFIRFGITNAYLHNYIWQGTSQHNAVATIVGSVYPNVYILIGGHHDSTTGGIIDSLRYRDPMYIAPGADDNASGAAATLELARVFMASGLQPKCSIILTTFSAEERGQWGSQSYAQYAIDNDLDIRLAINLDMIANNNPGNTLFKILRYDGSLGHAQNMANIAAIYTGLEAAWGFYNYNGTDSYAFWTSGFETLTVSEYNFSPYWHTEQDLTIHTDAAYCAQVIKAIAAMAVIYGNMPLVPQNLQVFDPGSGNSLQLTWDASPDPTVDHYKVYYSTSEAQMNFWQSTANTQCQITGLADGETYVVSVSSVDISGNESYWILGRGIPLSTPRMPVNLIDTPQFQAVNLSWAANVELDLAGYRLYRSYSPDELGTLVTTVAAPDTAYTDSNVAGTLQYYYYRVCAIDHQGNQSAASAYVKTRPVTLNMGILVIDETKNYSGSTVFQPTDEAVDSFYAALLEGYQVATVLDLEENPATLRLADIGVYSSILWHGNDYADVGYPGTIREILRQYLWWGGNVFFSLYHPTTALEYNGGYPANFEPDSFIHEVIGIAHTDYSSGARFKYAIPQLPDFPPLQVDSLKTLAVWNGHIFQVESATPAANAESVYSYGSDYANDSSQGYLNGQSVAVLQQYGLGKTVTLSFPLYHMQEAAARVMVSYVFSSLFSEPSPVEDAYNPAPAKLSLLPNYPNPFNHKTSIRIETQDTLSPLKASVYNLRGQLVRILFQGLPHKANTLSWDGKDNAGNLVGSGIYLIQAEQKGLSCSRKLVLY